MLNTWPSDIVHEILATLDSRRDLSSVILSCADVYNAFHARPNSILRHVVANEIGMDAAVLPYAWRALKTLKRLGALPIMYSMAPANIFVGGMGAWPITYSPPLYTHDSLSEMGDELTVSADNMKAVMSYLREQHEAVSEMAKCYSVRYKESAKVYDSLDYKEARRFFTAAYLFWEYQALFFNPLRQVTLNNGLDIDADGDEDDDDYEGDDMDWRDDDDDEEDDEEEEDDGEQDKDTPEKRKIAESNTKSTIEQFLNDLPARELVWMHHYKEFLLAEVGEYLQSYPPPWPSLTSATSGLSYPLLSEEHLKHHILTAGPRFFRKWQQYWYPNDDRCHNCTEVLCMSDMLTSAIRRRGIGKQALEQPEFQILQQKGMIIHKCQKCGGPPDFNTGLFYNVTSLFEITCIWVSSQLPGSIGFNPVETKELNNRILNALVPAIAQTPHPPPDVVNKLQRFSRNLSNYQIVTEIMQHASIRAELSLAASRMKQDGSHYLNLSDDEDGDEDQDDGKNQQGSGSTTANNSSASKSTGSDKHQDQDDKTPKKPKEYRWSPHDLLCQQCFQPLLVQFYYDWWLDERQTNRIDRTYQNSFTGDCWWGADCTTQRRTPHAQKLNHCCPKIR